MNIPEAVLNHGAIHIVWRKVRTNLALNYPLPGEEHWLPAWTEGWAYAKGRGYVLVIDEAVARWNAGSSFNIGFEQLEFTGEELSQRYQIPESFYEEAYSE